MYNHLGISGFSDAKDPMMAYLESKKDYKVNIYKIDKEIVKKIKKHWGFTIDKWNYSIPK
jgi:hypothetical protein